MRKSVVQDSRLAMRLNRRAGVDGVGLLYSAFRNTVLGYEYDCRYERILVGRLESLFVPGEFVGTMRVNVQGERKCLRLLPVYLSTSM